MVPVRTQSQALDELRRPDGPVSPFIRLFRIQVRIAAGGFTNLNVRSQASRVWHENDVLSLRSRQFRKRRSMERFVIGRA